MVKKRVRDAEDLPDAPVAGQNGNDSDSDSVCSLGAYSPDLELRTDLKL